jgi:nicotinamide-nucleotide amidase
MLAGRIEELDQHGNPTLAFQASGVEGLKVRITAKAASETAAARMIAAEEAEVRALLGDAVFGIDEQTMESVVLDLLAERGLTLGVAESVTGGMIGARLTAIAGASKVFRGGITAYASDVKYSLLGVPEGPVVSAGAAAAMALGACRVLGTDVGLATTGVAGPDEQEGQPVGTVFLGVALNGETRVERTGLPGRRDTIRQLAVISVLNMLRLQLR